MVLVTHVTDRNAAILREVLRCASPTQDESEITPGRFATCIHFSAASG